MQSSVATKKQFKRPGARVRASFTLSITGNTRSIHWYDASWFDHRMKKRQMQSYILEKAVMLENVNISFHVTGEEIEAECSARFQLTFVPGLGENICRKEKLKRSYPPDDIRRLRAVKKMLGDS